MSVSGTYQNKGVKYHNKVFKVEPFGIENVEASERHGKPFHLFTLWLGANLTIADFALGFLPIHLGISWSMILISIVIGNVLGGLLLAAAATMGPYYGTPQLIIGRISFGRIGGYVPALLNWIGTIGWFTVNNILGVFGLQVLFPNLSFLFGALVLIVIQGILAIYGHNLIHAFERVMALGLGILFLIASIISGSHVTTLQQYQGVTDHPLAMTLITMGAAFSYISSWAPYASDYSRYLPKETSLAKVFWCTFFGSVIASIWLELLGATVAILARPHSGNAIQSLAFVTGHWGDLMVIAVVLGGIASNALNLYSNALSAGALDLRIGRTPLTIVAIIIGLMLCLLGAGRFESFYEDFLLMLGYWVAPWVAILIIEFFSRRLSHEIAEPKGGLPAYRSGLGAFLIGVLISIPFMSSTMYTGPFAKAMNGADISFYVAFLVAGVAYLITGGVSRTEKA